MSRVDDVDGQPRSDSSVLADLVDRLTAKMQAGEAIDWEDVARQHPQHAGELLRLRPALGALGDLSRSGAEELSGVAPPAALADGLASGVLGDFRILREIGRGGMGVVYEAEQISLHRRVALKVLPFAATMDPRHLQRFQNEARAAARLHHTNIVPIFAVGCERGVHFYAMQLIDGCTLADAIQRCGDRPSPSPPTPLPQGARGVFSFSPPPRGRGVGGEGAGADVDCRPRPTCRLTGSRTRRRTRRRRPGNRRWVRPAAGNTSGAWRSWASRPRRRWTTPIRSASSIATSSRATCCWTGPAACGWPTSGWRICSTARPA